MQSHAKINPTQPDGSIEITTNKGRKLKKRDYSKKPPRVKKSQTFIMKTLDLSVEELNRYKQVHNKKENTYDIKLYREILHRPAPPRFVYLTNGSHYENNDHITEFCRASSPFHDHVYQPYMRSFLNYRELKKECTEAMSCAKRVLEIYRSWCIKENVMDTTQTDIPKQIQEDTIIVDLCSGKGFISATISTMLPFCQCVMVDKGGLNGLNLNHLNHPYLANRVEFVRTYLRPSGYKTKTPYESPIDELLQSLLKKYNRQHMILVGCHLCTFLSELFTTTYLELDFIKGMVLSPCCTRKDKDNEHIYSDPTHFKEQTHLLSQYVNQAASYQDDTLRLDELSQETVYNPWSLYILSMLHKASKKLHHIGFSRDPHMLSDRNFLLTSFK